MTEEKISKTEALAKSVEKISDSKGLVEIGKALGNGLVALAIAIGFIGFYFALSAGNKWDGHLYAQENCFKLQEISGKVYKVNSCTGEVTQFESKANEKKN